MPGLGFQRCETIWQQREWWECIPDTSKNMYYLEQTVNPSLAGVLSIR